MEVETQIAFVNAAERTSQTKNPIFPKELKSYFYIFFQ